MDIRTKISKLNNFKEEILNTNYDNRESLDNIQIKLIRFLEKRVDKPEYFLKKIQNIKYTPNFITPGTRESEWKDKWLKGRNRLIGVIESVIDDFKDDLDDEFKEDNGLKNEILQDESKEDYKNIFIIHGHDNELKQEIARHIEKMGLKATILHEQINNGNTIIEKFERLSNEADFAIALFSEDDELAGQFRARQNVVLEYGYFIAKLGREKMMIIKKGNIEMPSDISGVLYEDYSDGNWKVNLARILKNEGFNIDMNRVIQ